MLTFLIRYSGNESSFIARFEAEDGIRCFEVDFPTPCLGFILGHELLP